MPPKAVYWDRSVWVEPLASAAQFIETDGFGANPQAVQVVHFLAWQGAETVSDPDFQAMIMALLDRVKPGYNLMQPGDDDPDDGPPVPGL